MRSMRKRVMMNTRLMMRISDGDDFDEDTANQGEDDGGIKYVNEGQQPCIMIIC